MTTGSSSACCSAGGAAADPAEARAEATEAGRARGRVLVEPLRGDEPPTPERSVARLLALLDGLGFAPRSERGGGTGTPDRRIRLRHCPFPELAEEYGGLVCPLHLELMQGAWDRLGAPLTAGRLEPFAEPESCLAHSTGTPAA
ncbi:hypothetical protein [Streptomyces sp. NPDC006193]|uniref:hypothetical protein n=1 Tax=Streptomyces sp. NPDC006193 TaxID=3155717 RepID=UPI0033A9BD09